MDISPEYLRVKNMESQTCMLNIPSILTIHYDPNHSLLTTRNEKFLCPITLSGIEDIAAQFGFTQSDKFIYVNMHQVTKMHSILNILLFENVESVKESRKNNYIEAYIHKSFLKKFKNLLGRENDLAYKKERAKNSSIIYKRTYNDELI
ncbi:LytTR family transcriptional regulator DNA-binding domain-containing protein [Paenibacillus sp. HB172176]|uniref:LytTR family transcriptional regulator DNA-binding domain-containing protein n=1 Tax=Paenibacillus sp. HB172176 TaxID=2493690 RepID=UPI00143AD63C|nr:LytTR family transcriptional regulator DNA-binding domain-containing protein [Paenibacillus sp. HB172176]